MRVIPFVFCLAMTAAVTSFGHVVMAADDQDKESLRIVIELDEEGRYDPGAVARQVGRFLEDDDHPRTTRRKAQLTPADRLSLLLLDQLDVAHLTFTPRKITIEFRTSSQRLGEKSSALLRRWLAVPDDYWSERYGLQTPPERVQGSTVIVALHGLEGGLTTIQPLARACADRNIPVVPFLYPNDGPLADSARHLSQALKEWNSKRPNQRIVLVAHSMGGLVARYCLEKPSLTPGNVSALVTLGTPHRGSSLARYHPLLELIKHTSEGLDSLRRLTRDGMGEAADDLMPGSNFLKTLETFQRPPDVRYYVAAGSRSFLSNAERLSILRSLREERPGNGGSSAQIADELTRLLESPELSDGLGDGVVSLQSALFRPNDGERVFRRNHVELMRISGANDEVLEWLQTVLERLPASPNPANK